MPQILFNLWLLIDVCRENLPFTESRNIIETLPGSRPITSFEPLLLSLVPEITTLMYYHRATDGTGSHFHSTLTDQLVTDFEQAPAWLVVACQTCMDINEIVDPSCGEDALSSTLATMRHIADEYETFHGFKYSQAASPTLNESIASIRGQASGIAKAMLPADHLLDGDPHGLKTLKYRIVLPGVQKLPHLAGDVCYSIKTRLHQQSMMFANEGGLIMMLAHLYRAGKVAQFIRIRSVFQSFS